MKRTLIIVSGLVVLVAAPALALQGGSPHGGRHCTITGTSGDDTIRGTNHRDVICAKGGDDDINARLGDDLVFGGRGSDGLEGGPGADVLNAGAGRDWAWGEDGPDHINGGTGSDKCLYAIDHHASDVIRGGDGADDYQKDLGDRAIGVEDEVEICPPFIPGFSPTRF